MNMLLEACSAAMDGNAMVFSELLGRMPVISSESDILVDAVINSKNPKELIDAWIKIKGEPTLDALHNFKDIADRDRCVDALVLICDKIITHKDIQNIPREIRKLATIIQKHKGVKAANYLVAHCDKWGHKGSGINSTSPLPC
jgi:hypothetical protein